MEERFIISDLHNKNSRNAANDESIFYYVEHLSKSFRYVYLVTNDKGLKTKVTDNHMKFFFSLDVLTAILLGMFPKTV